jgi:hypothetical protein
MQQNAALNVGAPNIHIVQYDWGTLPADIPVKEADVVLAADCVYFEVSLLSPLCVNARLMFKPAFPLLVKTLCDLAPLGKDIEILFCWKKRRKVSPFKSSMREWMLIV